MYQNSLKKSFQIIVLDHHYENDQRIIRHISHCQKNHIPVHRIRISLQNFSADRDTDNNENYSSINSF